MQKKELLATTIIVMKYAVQHMMLNGVCSKLYKDNECDFYPFKPEDVFEIAVIERSDKRADILFTLRDGRIFHENGALVTHKELDISKITQIAALASPKNESTQF